MEALLSEVELKRFRGFYMMPSPNHCWLWRYGDKDKYANFYTDSKVKWLVHRLAYTLWVGNIPKGYIVHHKCRSKRCTNPRHLLAITYSEHRKIHGPKGSLYCDRGHKFTSIKLHPVTGRRIATCKKCVKLNSARYRASERERAKHRGF